MAQEQETGNQRQRRNQSRRSQARLLHAPAYGSEEELVVCKLAIITTNLEETPLFPRDQPHVGSAMRWDMAPPPQNRQAVGGSSRRAGCSIREQLCRVR